MVELSACWVRLLICLFTGFLASANGFDFLTLGIPRLHVVSFTAYKSSTCFCCNLAQTLHHMYCDQCHHCREHCSSFSYKDIWSPVFPLWNKPGSGQLTSFIFQTKPHRRPQEQWLTYGRGANDHNLDLGIKSFPKSSQVNVSLLHENCSLAKN